MAKNGPPYTFVVSRKLASGKFKDYWRFRRNGTNTALPGHPGEPEFHSRYIELMALEERLAQPKALPKNSSFEWLCDEYLNSVEFTQLSESTQIDYRRIINQRLLPALGPERYDCITRAAIKLVRDNVAKTNPRTGHKVKQVASVIYSWADQNDLVEEAFNPAANLKKLKHKVKPIEIWSDEEITLFMSNAPEPALTVALLALYTGQRRTDLALMEWNQFQGDVIRVRQNKTGEPLVIPCHSTLKEHLIKIRTNFGGPILRGERGKPMTPNSISSSLNRAVKATPGMPHRTIHGLRYAAAGKLEDAHCSVEQIMSIVGHRTYQMARKYFSQRSHAMAAIKKMENKA